VSEAKASSPAPRRAGKAPGAFRTISEVAGEVDVPQHVLRFWETKFSHIRPLKRGGGRRYYRPDDVALLRRIKGLLYDDGYTIKGVQRLLRDGVIKANGEMAAPLPSAADARRAAIEEALVELRAAKRILEGGA